MALEMQKLQKDHGVNPILGCLPMLAHIPVFLGLYHVLMSFNRTQHGCTAASVRVARRTVLMAARNG
jgi:YidC/Oxa1 family membrane protein insertase